MSRRPRCNYCGTGLSRKHRVTDPEARLLAAIFDVGHGCGACTERLLSKRAPKALSR